MFTVLAVDDDDFILTAYQQRLKLAGFTVLTAPTGEAALELLKETKGVDLVILDRMMPGMDGIETFKQIKENIVPCPPTIMATTNSSIHLAVEFMKIGGIDFIEKPLDFEILVIKINKGIQNYKLLQDEINARQVAEESLIQAKIKAEEADRLKSHFLASMSHEIRTPLNAILGFSELLSTELDGQQKAHLNVILNNSNVLMALIGDILDFSKIEAHQLDIEHIPYSLRDIYTSVGANAEMLLSKKGKHIELKYSIPDEIDYCFCDPLRFQQILNNLLSNAIKFTDSGFIEFGVKIHDKNKLKFHVKDTGIGIPPDKQELIFTPFRQANSSTSRQFGGTGLGLAIVKNLVELMGGEISLDSQVGENHGSCFSFILPYEPVQEQELQNLANHVGRSFDNKGHKILLVEDNDDNRILAQRILKKMGFNVINAGDGAEAISMFKEDDSIDLILMDMFMPNVNGIEATAAIRSLERERGGDKPTPIIALTAEALKSEREKFMAAGCDAYVTKPINKQMLVGTIGKFVS